ncbi:MAG TPA: serine/threonine-protein kinase [Polyangiaceae bacterium]|nr:serine/threonine-protein kinase [Polyangiaceae bacterium]
MQSSTKTSWGSEGTVIADRYRLDEAIVRGAMGTIWRAEHLRLRAPVAVKLLDPILARDQEMRGRFLQEARSAAAVRSSHVVQIFDSGIEGGLPYIVMELLEGESLDVRLAERGPLSPGELRKVFGEVARALAKAHSLGVVHRDVKPSNIFLSREGPYEITKLVDFGIAKVKSESLQFTHVGTKMGTLLGTPQYMSPEQARGSCTVDYRTDLWAMAIVACECLTGRCPFSGKTVGDLTVQICTERPTAPSQLGDVPPGFDAWFFKATGKTPGQRFKSMAAMDGALTPILAAAEARAALISVPRGWVPRHWSLPPLPSVSQIRSVSATVLTRLESRWFRVKAWARSRLDLWLCLLPEERRRFTLVAVLSICGLALLLASSLQRSGRHHVADVAPAALAPAAPVAPAALETATPALRPATPARTVRTLRRPAQLPAPAQVPAPSRPLPRSAD